MGVFQPYQFRRASHLCWAIERRLSLAKLQWIAMATKLGERGLYGERKLQVLVRRSKVQGPKSWFENELAGEYRT